MCSELALHAVLLGPWPSAAWLIMLRAAADSKGTAAGPAANFTCCAVCSCHPGVRLLQPTSLPAGGINLGDKQQSYKTATDRHI